MTAKYLASNLKYLRKKIGKSQSGIAFEVDKRSTAISSWENGQSEPSIDDMLKLSGIFGVTLNELIGVKLDDVHLIEKTNSEKNGENVLLNVPPSVHLKLKKGAKAPLVYDFNEPETNVLHDDGKQYGPVLMPRVVTIDARGEENSVFVPVKARAGYLLGYGDAEFIGTLPTYKMPGGRDKTYRVFEVDGNSMFNTLHDKDLVNAYWVRLSEIRDGRVYVLVTRTDGIIIKRVINRFKEGILVCKSDNNHRGEHPPIILNIHDVLEVWYVEGNFTRNLAPPGEIYDRMLQLEADVAVLKHNLKAKS